jgi:benzoylformate decarboxylase
MRWASGGLGVVNLHISCGLGNAMGMLYNAYREGNAALGHGGQQDRRLMFEEPILWGQMVEVVRPWTKWAARCSGCRTCRLRFAARHRRRVDAADGAGVLSLPVDVQMSWRGDYDNSPIKLPDDRRATAD